MRLPQFTLARILLAIFWLAVGFAAWREVIPQWIEERMRGLPVTVLHWLWVARNSWKVFPFPTAVGALFGHTLRGFIVGVVLFVNLWALVYLAIAMKWVGGPT